jgi:dolichyl-phosphate-mannose-protein mannosyltransferase
MASPHSTIRQRGGHKEKKQMNGKTDQAEEYLDNVIESSKKAISSEWDYKLGLLLITILSFITRFWGISHPNEVVFDEVHFGKVRIIHLWQVQC